jgi:hypothetical protein
LAGQSANVYSAFEDFSFHCWWLMEITLVGAYKHLGIPDIAIASGPFNSQRRFVSQSKLSSSPNFQSKTDGLVGFVAGLLALRGGPWCSEV